MCTIQRLFFLFIKYFATSIPDTSAQTLFVSMNGITPSWYAYMNSPTPLAKFRKSYQKFSALSYPYSFATNADSASSAERIPKISMDCILILYLRGRSQITFPLFGITAPCAAFISLRNLIMNAALVSGVRLELTNLSLMKRPL